MTTPVLRIPTVCPKCGAEGLVSLPVDRVGAGLMRGRLNSAGRVSTPRGWRATSSANKFANTCRRRCLKGFRGTSFVRGAA